MWAAAGPVVAQQGPRPVKPAYDDGSVEVLPVHGNVHLVAGSGANIAVQVDPEVLFVVDTSVTAMSERLRPRSRSISDKPIRQIINTSADETSHRREREPVECRTECQRRDAGGQGGREPARLEGAPIIAHELVLHRMSGLKGEPARMPFGVWPHDTFYTNRKQITSAARSWRCCTCRPGV